MLSLVLVRLSESFAAVWSELAADLGVALRDRSEGDVIGADVAAVLVAAGGAEREALEWLDANPAPPDVPRFVVGADVGRRIAAQAVGAGARDYFALPDDLELLRNALAGAVARRRDTARRSAAAAPKADAFAEIVGESAALKTALARAARALPHADATVLITGETGTGKELLAQALHRGGPRAGTPFVEVNCTTLPATLLESELFGHERGAFTDAHAAKPGLFEVADGGTLFLDEIGHLDIALQVKLLRVIEDKDVRRVGGMTSRRVDVRIVAATNEDLPRAVRQGTFREDLYFRLSVVTLSLPPLRARGEDSVLIAQALLGRLAGRYDLPVPPVDAAVRRAILSYHWPGNVRELKNAVERALLLSPPGELRVEELVPTGPGVDAAAGAIPFPAPLAAITAAAARAMLDLCQGNRSEAARRLGISRARLARLLID